MFTTICHYHLSPYKLQKFFLWLKTFMISLLLSFQVGNPLLLTVVTMIDYTSWIIYFITGSLYFFIPFTHFSHQPTILHSVKHTSILCIYEFCFDFPYFIGLSSRFRCVSEYIAFVFLSPTWDFLSGPVVTVGGMGSVPGQGPKISHATQHHQWLSMTYFSWRDTLKVHPYWYKWNELIHFYGWVVFHSIHILSKN